MGSNSRESTNGVRRLVGVDHIRFQRIMDLFDPNSSITNDLQINYYFKFVNKFNSI